MTDLMKLKSDRDTCYILACAAYGKEYVDINLYEPDEYSETQDIVIQNFRAYLIPININDRYTEGYHDGEQGDYRP